MNKKKIISSVIFGICIITILVLSIIDIINVGIKHSGINLIVPEVIEQEQLDSIKLLSKNPKYYVLPDNGRYKHTSKDASVQSYLNPLDSGKGMFIIGKGKK